MSNVPDYSRMGELEFLIRFQDTFFSISRMALKIPECTERERTMLFEGREIVDALYAELLHRYAK